MDINQLKSWLHQSYRGEKNMLYDIENLMKEAQLSEEEKKKIISELKEEFPQDEMLFELHLFRVIQYLKKQKMKKSVNLNSIYNMNLKNE